MPFYQATIARETKRCCIRPINNVEESVVKEKGRAGEAEEKEKVDSKDEEEQGLEAQFKGVNWNEEEEGRKIRIPNRPATPTKAEIEDHETLHFPPRDWCQHCVAGHGIANQHRRQTDEEHDNIGVTISVDYCFMRDGERESGVSPILIMWDANRKALWVLPVDN